MAGSDSDMKKAAAAAHAQVDHLVIAAASLDEGLAWCEATLGVIPGPGGEHPLMGTHNRLMAIASPDYPRAYLEIIAVHAGAPKSRAPEARRWFDLDDRDLQARLHSGGPQLIHFVASTNAAEAAVLALRALGLERGPLLSASRMTASGLLSWKISVREDGQRLFYGALPTLIEWGETHPSQALMASGVVLRSLSACHPRPAALRAAHEAIGLAGVALEQGAPNLIAALDTPRGRVLLESKGH
jgi:hypothetical protein